MTEPRINDTLEDGSSGFIEAVKRTLVVSLRRALTDSGLSLNDTVLHVDMEYPYEEASYPSAWVQFSFTELIDSGMGHVQTTMSEDQEARVRQWRYKGRVSVTFLALSSLDRDRIADKFISVFAFADVEKGFSNDPSTRFLQELAKSPYVSLTPQSGRLNPGGQSTSVGVPWDPTQLVYEDTYSFNLEGEFQQVYIPGEGFRLRKIEIAPTLYTRSLNNPRPSDGWI